MTQSLKHQLDMLDVIIERLRENYDVVKVNKTKRILVSSEYLIHYSLESGRGIAKTLRHEFEFVKSSIIGESSILSMILMNGDLKITGLEIDCSDKCCSTQRIKGFTDAR